MSNTQQLDPTIRDFDGATIVGLTGSFEPLDPEIGTLWHTFVGHGTELGELPVGTRDFGLCCPVAEPGDTIDYTAGRELLHHIDPPKPFVVREIPAGTYAVFTHRGPISTLHETVRYIWGTWARRTSLVLRSAPDFELYGPRFRGESPDSELDIYIPVERAQDG